MPLNEVPIIIVTPCDNPYPIENPKPVLDWPPIDFGD